MQRRGLPDGRPGQDLYQTRVSLEAKLIAAVPGIVPYELVLASVQLERARLSALLRAREERSASLEDLPLVVLTRGADSPGDLVASHAVLAALSTNSRHTVVEGAGHEIHLFRPDVVVSAIRDGAEAGRNGRRIAGR